MHWAKAAVFFGVYFGLFGRLSLDVIGMSVMLRIHGGEMLYRDGRIKIDQGLVSNGRE